MSPKVHAEYNRVIEHAVSLGLEAHDFLVSWNEGDWEGCREFGFEPNMEVYQVQPEQQADRQQVPEAFTDWLCREMPPGTIISDPAWWAPKIARAMLAAVVQKAAAWVPVHPKTGPLWAMTTDSPDPERLPAYPLRSLYYTHPALAAAPEAPAQAVVPAPWRKFVAEVVASAESYERRTGKAVNAEWVKRGKELLATAPEAPAQAAVAQAQPIPLNIIRKWPDGFEARLQHVWKDVISFTPNVKLWDLQRVLAEFGFRMEVYGQAATEAPAQASAVDERAAFEAWYSQNAFNFERDPIGSRDCGLQWKAWQARAALAQKGGAA